MSEDPRLKDLLKIAKHVASEMYDYPRYPKVTPRFNMNGDTIGFGFNHKKYTTSFIRIHATVNWNDGPGYETIHVKIYEYANPNFPQNLIDRIKKI